MTWITSTSPRHWRWSWNGSRNGWAARKNLICGVLRNEELENRPVGGWHSSARCQFPDLPGPDCQLNYPTFIQFAWFLGLFIPGAILFTTYWLVRRPDPDHRRSSFLGVFVVL